MLKPLSISIIASLGIASLGLSACVSQVGTQTQADRAEPTFTGQPPTSTVSISEAAIEAHIRFLSDDMLRGRYPGEEGYDIAARYVESQFRLIGLHPAGSDGYYDPVPLNLLESDPAAASLVVDGTPLTVGEDFYVEVHGTQDTSQIFAEAVFAGYGLTVPRLGFNDYADLDVEGRIAVILDGVPDGLGSEATAHLSALRSKADMAEAAGAAGLIIINFDRSGRSLFDRLAAYARRPNMTTLEAHGGTNLSVIATVNESAAAHLFQNAATGLDAVFERVELNETIEGFALNTTVEMTQSTSREPVASDNVIAILPGSDPQLADQSVVVTAHLDHIGTCRPEGDEDRICNGAVDNASGIAIMLETARAIV